MIEAPLGLLEVQIERVMVKAIELRQASLREAPEALDPIDMLGAAHELILVVMEPIVLGVAEVDEPIVGRVRVGVELARQRHPTLDHCHESGDRKSTRLNSSHSQISYAVFCLKKKK